MIAYRTSDRIRVAVDDIEISISPLNHHDKNAIQTLLVAGKVESLMEGSILALKCGIKSIRGVKYPDGSDLELVFENESDRLSDSSVDTLLNLPCHNKLSSICLELIEGIPSEFVNPETKEVIEGVRIIKEDVPEKKQ